MSETDPLLPGSLPEQPVVVFLGAPWVAPWKLLSKELATNSRIIPVNVDSDPAAAELHRVICLPTAVCVLNGQELGRLSGAMSSKEIVALLNAGQ